MSTGRLCRVFSLDALAKAPMFYLAPREHNGGKSGSSAQVHHVFASSGSKRLDGNIRAVSGRYLPIYSAAPGSF